MAGSFVSNRGEGSIKGSPNRRARLRPGRCPRDGDGTRQEVFLYLRPQRSAAHSVAFVVLVVWTAAHASLIPFIYENCKTKNYSAISKVTLPILAMFGGTCILLILLAPEAIALMATHDYREAIYVVPPVVAGVFFQVHCYLYADVLYYYKKPRCAHVRQRRGHSGESPVEPALHPALRLHRRRLHHSCLLPPPGGHRLLGHAPRHPRENLWKYTSGNRDFIVEGHVRDGPACFIPFRSPHFPQVTTEPSVPALQGFPLPPETHAGKLLVSNER